LHQVGTSSLLIYMMHGHTYIKVKLTCFIGETTQCYVHYATVHL